MHDPNKDLSSSRNKQSLIVGDLLATIKDYPISAVIGHYLPITTRGSTKLAICPFHPDKNPSLNISDSRKSYKCFSCGAFGDSITFIANFKNLPFMQAMETACEILGIDFSKYKTERTLDPKILLAQKILTRAALLYRKVADDRESLAFREFLDKRKLKPEMALKFGVGLAPRGNVLVSYLNSIPNPQERDMAINMARDIGLIRPSQHEDQSYYDTFRERIMFPIWDQRGHVIGFTGRDISGKSPAKYYNSQESIVFKKRKLLYGLHFAKSFIRERKLVIICEGNMDLIALHQNGFENSVAIMGTAMDVSSLKILKSLASNFVLALDNDRAGHQAAERIHSDCLALGLMPKYLSFSPAKDPDEFLLEHGSLEFAKRLEEAPYFLDYRIQEMIPKPIPETLEGKLLVLQSIFALLSPLKTDLQATERLAMSAKALGLRSGTDSILVQYQEFLQNGPERPKVFEEETTSTEISTHEVSLEMPSPQSETPAPLSKAEHWLVRSWIQYPKYFADDKQLELLDLVHSLEVKRFLGRLRELFFEVDDSEFSELALTIARTESFSAPLIAAVGPAVWTDTPTLGTDPKILERLGLDLVKKLKEEKLQARRKVLRDQALRPGHEDMNEDLMRELNQLEIELVQLRSPSK